MATGVIAEWLYKEGETVRGLFRPNVHDQFSSPRHSAARAGPRLALTPPRRARPHPAQIKSGSVIARVET